MRMRGVRDADGDRLQGANRSHSHGEDLQRRSPPKSAPARPRRDRKRQHSIPVELDAIEHFLHRQAKHLNP